MVEQEKVVEKEEVEEKVVEVVEEDVEMVEEEEVVEKEEVIVEEEEEEKVVEVVEKEGWCGGAGEDRCGEGDEERTEGEAKEADEKEVGARGGVEKVKWKQNKLMKKHDTEDKRRRRNRKRERNYPKEID